MEKINGEYQERPGHSSGFQSGIVRLAWAKDGSLIAGETNRGCIRWRSHRRFATIGME
jgi:hypothetical protein